MWVTCVPGIVFARDQYTAKIQIIGTFICRVRSKAGRFNFRWVGINYCLRLVYRKIEMAR